MGDHVPRIAVDKVFETRVTTTLRELLSDILDGHFDGTDDLFIFVDNKKVSLDAPVALTLQRYARDVRKDCR